MDEPESCVQEACVVGEGGGKFCNILISAFDPNGISYSLQYAELFRETPGAVAGIADAQLDQERVRIAGMEAH